MGEEMIMGWPVWCSLLLLLPQQFLWVTTVSSFSSLPTPSTVYCGSVEIPYPFGVINANGTLQEAAAPGFEVWCDILRPTLNISGPVGGREGPGLQILDISLDKGLVRVSAGAIAQHCDGDMPGAPDAATQSSSWIDLEGTLFTFSNTSNRFTVIGCDALAMMQMPQSPWPMSGCVAFCDAKQGPLNLGCSGVGCCQSAIPPGLQSFNLKFSSVGTPNNSSGVASFDKCSKAFLMQDDQFSFTSDLVIDVKRLPNFPLVLEWVIGNETCSQASGSPTYACKNNTQCYNSPAGVGYRCRCQEGYSGNPYLPQGCQDINECDDPTTNDCIGVCINTLGSYQCRCDKGMIGDGRKGGNGCTKKSEENLLKVIIGICIAIFCLLAIVGSLWSYWLVQRRRLLKLKEIFFRQNGGLLLQRQIASRKGNSGGTRIFTTEEIQKATDNFNENQILGRGGQGTVYKGVLPDKRVVAIKKSRISNETQIEQFINEVIILSDINNRNVVKLLGCCLETQVPLLVYEFVPNGTLSDHIHDNRLAKPLTWDQRLRIAEETAGVLAYLHSAASIPIIHRDVKSTNILLDEKFTAKVSDFGASRSVPIDKTHVTTLVKGTLGYLDPEYFQTSRLTEKSDVYSFGIVLVELLTREKPLSSVRPVEERNLASHFITSLEEKRLRRVLDAEIVQEVGIEHLGIVARLARRCLSLKGEERPSMKEVAIELELARRFLKQELGSAWNHTQDDQYLCGTSRSYSLEEEILESMDFRR